MKASEIYTFDASPKFVPSQTDFPNIHTTLLPFIN